MLGRLRQQGGATVLTVPNAIIAQLGWQVGKDLNIEMQGERVILSPVRRQAKGRKNVAQLLEGIDSAEIQMLNENLSDLTASEPQGKEFW